MVGGSGTAGGVRPVERGSGTLKHCIPKHNSIKRPFPDSESNASARRDDFASVK